MAVCLWLGGGTVVNDKDTGWLQISYIKMWKVAGGWFVGFGWSSKRAFVEFISAQCTLNRGSPAVSALLCWLVEVPVQWSTESSGQIMQIINCLIFAYLA